MTVQINGDNTIAAPGFSGPDADTGLQTATNELSLVTGGSARLFIDSSGRVGVGTSSPTHTLEVAGKIAVVGTESALGNSSIPSIYRSGSDSGSYPFDDFGHLVVQPRCDGANRDIVFATGTSGANKVVINSSGRLGVGTTSPHQTLDIGGTTSALIKFSPTNQGTTATDGGYIGHNFGGYELWQYESNYMRFATANTERMRIDSSGRVGIGTSSPAGRLEIKDNGYRQGIVLERGGSTTDRGFIYIGDGTNSTVADEIYLDAHNTAFHFRQGSTGTTETVTFKSDGKVGIGVTSPSATLDAVAESSLALGLRIRGRSSDDTGIIQFTDNNASAQTAQIQGTGTSALVFSSGASERARIDSSGRLLVGTSTARSVGQVTGGFHLTGTGSGSCLNLSRYSNNTGPAILHFGKSRGTSDGSYTSVSSGDQLGSITFAGADGTDLNSIAANISAVVDGTPGSNDMPGRLVFSTTADGASSPTERMRIDSTGAITQATQPILKTNATHTYGSAGSLTSTPASAIAQGAAQIDRGDNGWTTSGSNAYTFVCPVAGIYAVFANVSYGDIAQGNRVIWVMGYTLGGGSLPLSNYVEVLDHTVADYMNESYYDLWSFTAGTRVGMGFNGVSGSQSGYSLTWGMHLVA